MKYLTILGLFSLSNAYAYDNMTTVVSCYANYTRTRIPEPRVPSETKEMQTPEFKCAMVQGQRSAFVYFNESLQANLKFTVNKYKSLMPSVTMKAGGETLQADKVRRFPAKETEPLDKMLADFDASQTMHEEGCLIDGTCKYNEGTVKLHCKFEYSDSVFASPCQTADPRARPAATAGIARKRPQFDMDEDPIVIDGRPRIEGDDRRPGQAPFVEIPRVQQRTTPMDLAPESPPVLQPLVPRRYTPSTP